MKLKEIVPSASCLVLRSKKMFAAALVVGAGTSVWAAEEVVAVGEAEFWLGPAGVSVEEVVAFGEKVLAGSGEERRRLQGRDVS